MEGSVQALHKTTGNFNRSPNLMRSTTNGFKNSELQAYVNDQLTLHQAMNEANKNATQRNFFASSFVSGKRIDDVCQKKEMKLKDESAKVAELMKEKDQLKALNNKLNERVELL